MSLSCFLFRNDLQHIGLHKNIDLGSNIHESYNLLKEFSKFEAIYEKVLVDDFL